MQTYNMYGIIHPERAILTFGPHKLETSIGSIYFNILNNHLIIEIKSEEIQTDILTLKNDMQNIIQEEVSLISYIYGNGYFVEIIRVTNLNIGIDMVFGIDIPCINQRNIDKISRIQDEITSIHAILDNEAKNSIYIRRCFGELNKAIRFPLDTGFHCYRALESLRHFCGVKFNINEVSFPKEKKDKSNYLEILQWDKLRELTGLERESIECWKQGYAFNARHGNHITITDKKRIEIFRCTWNIVDNFINSLKIHD